MAETTHQDDAQTALEGIRGTVRGFGPTQIYIGADEVVVTFTDDAWEAAKRILLAAGPGGEA